MAEASSRSRGQTIRSSARESEEVQAESEHEEDAFRIGTTGLIDDLEDDGPVVEGLDELSPSERALLETPIEPKKTKQIKSFKALKETKGRHGSLKLKGMQLKGSGKGAYVQIVLSLLTTLNACLTSSRFESNVEKSKANLSAEEMLNQRVKAKSDKFAFH